MTRARSYFEVLEIVPHRMRDAPASVAVVSAATESGSISMTAINAGKRSMSSTLPVICRDGMGYAGVFRRATVMAVLLNAVATPAALGDERVVAVPVSQYGTPAVTIDQGEALYFRNLDLTSHDVVARAAGPDGKPAFSTPLMAPSAEAFVEGSQYLTSGSYDFFCSIHPGMEGKLTVTDAGQPASRPGSGGGGGSTSGSGTSLTLRIMDGSAARIREAGRLRVRAEVSAPAHVSLKATARRGGKRVTVARGQRHFGSAGRATMRLALTKAGRRAVRSGTTVTVTGTAGSDGSGTAKRRLKR